MKERDTDFIAQRRRLIDLIAETRSLAVRVALLGVLLNRADPEGLETEADRKRNIAVLADTVRCMDRVAVLMETGCDPWDEVPGALCQWLAGFVAEHPAICEEQRRMTELSQQVTVAASENRDRLGPALRAHYAFRRGGFTKHVTEFCDALWASIDAERNADLARAAQASEAVRSAMRRLESIGKHVQMVAINASMEAARLGDAGRGFSVIATEFKAVSAEIRNLAASAHAEIANLQRREEQDASPVPFAPPPVAKVCPRTPPPS